VAEIRHSDITGLVLAGGRGARMGGVDKGLQLLQGQAMALHTAERLQSQTGTVMISANRQLDEYRSWGFPVVNDTLPDFQGPLAGMLAGLRACCTRWLLTCPCDSPHFPTDLARRLAEGRAIPHTLAMYARRIDAEGQRKDEPAFCLLHQSLATSLHAYLQTGQRKVMTWLQSVGAQPVPFDRPGDACAFANINTLQDLARLQSPAR
jgi:molybdopterin-guanine dinucleotide biosynthesis protein A